MLWYILKLMARPPHPHEEAAEITERAPLRTAGITPGPAQNPDPEQQREPTFGAEGDGR